jgi:DNA-binding transcriptional regulator GbsR (MarR family)
MNKKEKKQQRFIIVPEDIYTKLSPLACITYMALRYESNYKAECSPITRKIQFISNKTKISKKQVTRCLNELELHGLTKRNIAEGEQTTYLVAQELNYFNKNISISVSPDPETHSPDPETHSPDPVAHSDDIYNNTSKALQHSLQNNKNARADRAIFFTVDADDFSFSKFWNAYPLKQGETICRKIWEKKGLTTIAELILEKLEEQKRNDNKFLTGYIFSPKNYLQEERWKDEITKPIKTTKTNSEAMSEERKRVLSMSFLEKCAYDIENLERNTEENGDLL